MRIYRDGDIAFGADKPMGLEIRLAVLGDMAYAPIPEFLLKSPPKLGFAAVK